MNHASRNRVCRPFGHFTVAAILVLTLFTLLPFAGALEIHHIFAEVDHDAHEHSDFDLCQWVQKHTSGSLVIDPPGLVVLTSLGNRFYLVHEHGHSAQLFSAGSPRAPPLS